MTAKNEQAIQNVANRMEPFAPTHPGVVLKEEIEYRGISQRRIAKEMGVLPTQLNEVLNGKRQLTTEYALLFEAVLNIAAEPLLEMQVRYNMIMAKRDKTLTERLANIRKIAAVL